MTLELSETALLLEALRAPYGMELTAAVGTTFTLDLTALLAIPVAASLRDHDEGEAEPAELLETIRRYAARTVLFCQAGAIKVPSKYRSAHTFVEQTVVEVAKPKGGIFHPKFWVVRYEGGGRTTHRVLVLSRNLTFDRALDVIVRLDEDPAAQSLVDVADLTRVLLSLPTVAARQPPRPDQLRMIEGLAETLAAARLAVPAPFTSGRLVAGDPGRRSMPFHGRCDNALAVSPYLTGGAVQRFTGTAASWAGVISRRTSLNAVAAALQDVQAVLRVKDSVINAQGSVDAVTDDKALSDANESLGEEPTVRGLHAKMYVQDVGNLSTMWLGSANLTDAGFGTNHEMLVELVGPMRSVGVDAILDPRRQRRDLSVLVEDHEPSTGDDDSAEGDGIDDVEAWAYEVASRDVRLTVTKDDDSYSLALRFPRWDLPIETDVQARPLSLPDFVPIMDGRASWTGLAIQAVTPFLVLRVRRGNSTRLVMLRAKLSGDPAHRQASVIAHAITSRDDFFRYLAALLGTMGGPAGGAAGAGFHGAGWIADLRGDRVLEDLLTTVARAPDRLDTLQETLSLIESSPDTRDVVPAEFRQLWAAVRKARGRRRP